MLIIFFFAGARFGSLLPSTGFMLLSCFSSSPCSVSLWPGTINYLQTYSSSAYVLLNLKELFSRLRRSSADLVISQFSSLPGNRKNRFLPCKLLCCSNSPPFLTSDYTTQIACTTCTSQVQSLLNFFICIQVFIFRYSRVVYKYIEYTHC